MIYIWKKERKKQRGGKSQQDAENYGKNRRENLKKIKKRQAKRT